MSPITPIATYLLYLTLSLPNSQFCTHKDRTALNTTQVQPVCALYSGDCTPLVSGFCQKTYNNAQSACQDNNVLAYTTGECNQVSVQACSTYTQASSDDQVCSFSVQRRLGGASQEVVKSSVLVSEACKYDNTAFFVKSDCSIAENANSICTNEKRTQASKCTPTIEAVNCVYYAGGDCQAELCRKTQTTDCTLCKDSSVLFFTEGACENSIVVDINDPNGLDLSNDDAGVEAEVNNDDQNNGWDLSNDVPEVEAKTLEDGTIMLTPIEARAAKVQGDLNDPNGLDLSNDDAGVEPEVNNDDQNNGWDLSNDVPEVEAETLADGTIMLTPVESNKVAPEDDPNGWDLSNDDAGVAPEVNNDDQNNGWDLSNDEPAVEAETLEDGTIMLTPVESNKVAPEDDPNGWDLSNDEPAVEAEVLEDGTTILTPVESTTTQADSNGDDLGYHNSGAESKISSDPITITNSVPSSNYNTHNFKFLGNKDEAFKAELTNGAGEPFTVASFQEPTEEN
jgi:hypothetical protein